MHSPSLSNTSITLYANVLIFFRKFSAIKMSLCMATRHTGSYMVSRILDKREFWLIKWQPSVFFFREVTLAQALSDLNKGSFNFESASLLGARSCV